MKSRGSKWVAGGVAALIILFVFGVRIGHPSDGLKNALGSAQSGLVVYQTKPALVVKEKVLVHVPDSTKDPLLAFISANNGSTIDVQSGNAAFSVKPDQVYGKLILVIPFLGSIFGVVGL